MNLWQRLLVLGILAMLSVAHMQLASSYAVGCSQEFEVGKLVAVPTAVGSFVGMAIFGTIVLDATFNVVRYVGLFCIPCVMLFDMILGTCFIECSGWLGGGLVMIGVSYFFIWLAFYSLKSGVKEDPITSTDAPSDEKDREGLTESVQMAVSAAATMGAVFVV